jgi:hypothetical protein
MMMSSSSDDDDEVKEAPALVTGPVAAAAPAPDVQRGHIRIDLKLEVRDPCPIHAPLGKACTCMPVRETREIRGDLATKQFMQFIQANILVTAETITAEDSSTASIGGATPTTTSAVTIEAGTTGTAATVLDVALGTSTETIAGVVNAYSGSGSSGSFTVTGTVTAGANRAYQEVGLRITAGGKNFLLCHDTFSTLNVSSGGTLAVTYTITGS